ncbi:hypothetical protein [Sphingomonas montana]|uniref:hypothetical protein n=1 Tax=Sphingomonas montana TaxID=1843236 RepID=UPI00101AE20C|nr:hypothetical protein [Sphingomonas montana]
MFVFWWTGKGFFTPLILFGVLVIFGLILQAARPVLQDGPWFWGLAFIAAGAINWVVGRRQNSRKIAAVRTNRFRDTLIYRARNKFMSLPFEVWSIPFIAGGLIAIAYSLTNLG